MRASLKLDPTRYLLVPTTKNLSELDFVRTFHLPIFLYGLTFKPINPADGTVYSSSGFLRHDASHNHTMIIANAKRGYDIADPKLIAARSKWYPQLVKALEAERDFKIRQNIVKMIFNTVHELYFPLEYVFARESLTAGNAAWRMSGPEGYLSMADLEAMGPAAARELHARSIKWLQTFFDQHPEGHQALRQTIESRGYQW
jgi:hypothetical protein